jgi:peptidoglycan/xylan/chitin deacetylase (PgdA/CDA1 family)
LKALAEAGFEIGFHTRRHDLLPQLSDELLAAAMTDGRREVAAAAGREVTVISYPHGAADERVAAAARTAGYRLGFTAARQAARPTDDPHLVGRVGPTIRSSGRGALQIAFALLAAREGRA